MDWCHVWPIVWGRRLRKGSWGTLFYMYHRERQNSIGNYLAPFCIKTTQTRLPEPLVSSLQASGAPSQWIFGCRSACVLLTRVFNVSGVRDEEGFLWPYMCIKPMPKPFRFVGLICNPCGCRAVFRSCGNDAGCSSFSDLKIMIAIPSGTKRSIKSWRKCPARFRVKIKR